MLLFLRNKSSPMVEWEEKIHALCSTNDLEGTNRSYKQLLFLYGPAS